MTSDLTLIIALSVGVSILCALIGLRTTWLAGSFFSRSRVNVATPPAAAPTQSQQRTRSPEERLADLKSLRDRGVIDAAEYERTRAAVLQQLTSA